MDDTEFSDESSKDDPQHSKNVDGLGEQDLTPPQLYGALAGVVKKVRRRQRRLVVGLVSASVLGLGGLGVGTLGLLANNSMSGASTSSALGQNGDTSSNMGNSMKGKGLTSPSNTNMPTKSGLSSMPSVPFSSKLSPLTVRTTSNNIVLREYTTQILASTQPYACVGSGTAYPEGAPTPLPLTSLPPVSASTTAASSTVPTTTTSPLGGGSSSGCPAPPSPTTELVVEASDAASVGEFWIRLQDIPASADYVVALAGYMGVSENSPAMIVVVHTSTDVASMAISQVQQSPPDTAIGASTDSGTATNGWVVLAVPLSPAEVAALDSNQYSACPIPPNYQLTAYDASNNVLSQSPLQATNITTVNCISPVGIKPLSSTPSTPDTQIATSGTATQGPTG